MTSENPDSVAKNQSTNSDPKPPDKSETIPQFAPAGAVPKIQAPPSPHSYQITCNKNRDRYDKIKFWAELVGILFLIAYTYETCRTNNLTQCALNISKQQFTDSQRASKDQFEKAQTASTQQFRQDQRPYIWHTSVNNDFLHNGNGIVAIIQLSDFGKSPAIDERAIGKIFAGRNAMKQAEDWFVNLGNRRLGSEDASPTIIPPGIPQAIPQTTPHAPPLRGFAKMSVSSGPMDDKKAQAAALING